MKETKKITDAVEILHRRYIGDDPDRKASLEAERVNAEAERRMAEPIALVDMDGTLADYAKAMARDLKKLAAPGEEIPEDFAEDVPAHIKERQRLITKQPEWWYNLPVMPLGIEILNILRSLKFEIHILTKGPHSKPQAWAQKAQWCLQHVPDVKITITEDKGLVYGKVLVDDYPAYVERWLEWRPRGFVIMPAHHYNEGFQHPNVLRYTGAEDIEVISRLTEIRAGCE